MHVGAKVIVTGDHHGKQTQQFREDLEGKKGTVTKQATAEDLWWVQIEGEGGPLIFNTDEIKEVK